MFFLFFFEKDSHHYTRENYTSKFTIMSFWAPTLKYSAENGIPKKNLSEWIEILHYPPLTKFSHILKYCPTIIKLKTLFNFVRAISRKYFALQFVKEHTR